MKAFVERIINDWWEYYEDVCELHSERISDDMAEALEEGEDFFESDVEYFQMALKEKYPEYVFQFAGGRWFLINIL